MTVRIGVVADSHVGEYLPALPEGALEALEGCDLILHAGDLSVPEVLDDLAEVAPVAAVRGDHDRLGGLGLPETLVMTVAGHRIGLVHGRRPRPVDISIVAAHVAAGRRIRYYAGINRWLARKLGDVDCAVYGHWHDPTISKHGGMVCFSPGALCPFGNMEGGMPPRPGLVGVGDRGVYRFRRQLGEAAWLPSVGVIEVGSAGIRPRIVPLTRDGRMP